MALLLAGLSNTLKLYKISNIHRSLFLHSSQGRKIKSMGKYGFTLIKSTEISFNRENRVIVLQTLNSETHKTKPHLKKSVTHNNQLQILPTAHVMPLTNEMKLNINIKL